MKTKKENRLIVGDKQWAETIPQWLLDEVEGERMMLGLGSVINPECEKVGDAEIIVYLMTASLRAPLSSENVNIYLFLTAKLTERRHKEIPDFLKESLERGLTNYEQGELRELRSMIYNQRGGEIQNPILSLIEKRRSILLSEG